MIVFSKRMHENMKIENWKMLEMYSKYKVYGSQIKLFAKYV